MEEIKRIAEKYGAFKTGFSNINSVVPEKLSKYQYAVSVAVPLSKGILSEVKERPTYEYFHHYRTVNRLIDELVYKIAMYIESLGYEAYPIAASQSVKEGYYSGVFSHKAAARLAGIGWIGKNAMLITPEYGSRVRFGTILTNMPFAVETAIMEERCCACMKCTEKCPAGAVKGLSWNEETGREGIFDPKKCSEYMKEKFKDIGRGAVCGICINVCPYSNIKN